MRFAKIEEYDVVNGLLGGMSLFVQGCDFHCPGCFNSETWDFNGGYEWTVEMRKHLLKLLNRPYIQRISILGGEPLADENLHVILDLIQEIRVSYPDKSIWLYTGYTYEECLIQTKEDNDDINKMLRSKIINLSLIHI